MEAVAAGDHVALELAARVPNDAALGIDVLDLALEVQRQPALDPRCDEILHDLGLPVDDDRAPVGELAQRDVVALAVELEVDAVVDDPLAVHPLAHAEIAQQVGRALLEHAGADAVLAVLARAVLEHDGLDPGELEHAREREARRPGADDADLCPHSSSTRWKTWNALFAAGTPQ